MGNHSPAQRPTARVFLALMPSVSVRKQVDAQVRRWSWCPGSTLYAASDWHVTLHFLGDVPTHLIGLIAAGACLPFEPFRCVLDRWQHWPGGLVVMYPSSIPPALLALHERLGGLLRGMGQPVDARPYQPHLTLARHAGTAVPPTDFEPIHWPVHGFALVASTGKNQPRYEVVSHCNPPRSAL